ncbi:MAG: polysaccharide biosynthesis tyrosine autokinase [Pyrinomonadaceae bacterium]|nr:polysaccharide biosynthesis tyrosine autokinase [Sphingobacteriaceae bacterium]
MELIRKTTDNKESNITGHFIFRFLPYWPLFLFLGILSVTGAWLYLQFTTPLYEANARILIKDEKKGSEDSKALESLDLLSPKKIIDNELEVLHSNTIIYQVVKNLGLYAPVFEKKTFGSSPAYISSPISIITDKLDHVKSTENIPFTLNKSSIIIDNKGYAFNNWVRTPYGRLKFILNERFAYQTEGRKFYFSLVSPKAVVSTISSRLKVEPTNKQSSIVLINYKDEVPLRGENIVNELIKVYNSSIMDEKNSLARNTSEFIDRRLAQVGEELLSIENRLESYRSNQNAVDVGTQGKLYLENVSANDQKVSEINMQLSVLNQVENYIKSKDLSSGIVPSTVGVNDPGLSQMVKNIYELQMESESLKKTTGENNPVIVSYRDQIQKIRPQILENVQNQKRSLQASRNNLTSTNNTYSSALQSIPTTERTLVDIKRNQTIKNDIYVFLLQKREETALSYVSNVGGGKIIDNAEASDSPVSPNKKMIYLSALLFALLIGASVVTGKESLRRNIMFQKDIEQLTQLPVIGELTADKSNNTIVIGNGQRTLIAEQFRRLRATLSYLGLGAEKKRILVTSAISGEGKSFIATNLSLSLALTGKKVVLLDFDLNNPSLDAKLNMGQHIGITEFLLGETTPDKIIRQTNLDDNLSLISTGKLPRNPSELIMNGRAKELLDYLDNLFDYIIIDVAPVGPVSDAYILSPFCDATLYVIRHGFTPKLFVGRIDENNKLNKLTNAAIVFNGVSSRGFAGNSYGYGYGYGYVYGNQDESKKKTPILNLGIGKN